MFSLSIGTHLSVYPALLVPLCVVVLSHSRPVQLKTAVIASSCIYFLHLVITTLASRLLLPSWSSLPSLTLTVLSVPDLTPNIGLHWYFAIEMFDHFRSFFGAVFQIHVTAYVVPLGIKFRNQPLFAVVMMCGIIATFKSYPSVGDVALYTSLLPLFPEALTYMRHPLLTTSLFLYSAFLLPTFHHLWMSAGSGNANFYYASTLVWGLSNGFLLVDMLWGMLRREFEVETRVVRGGKELDANEIVVQG
jgi:phosphatidylinositol glycan class U